ncbi:MAG: aminodeoxychorismate synthase component I [Bacteroidota bacterium]|nr:aminodeoxychorismate synthase component I [Bacteroidota bacterium]
MEQAVKLMNRLGKEKIPFIFIIDFDMQRPIVVPIDELQNSDTIFYDINGKKNFPNYTHPDKELTLSKTPVSFDTYQQAFKKVIKSERDGDSYLLNLTFSSKIECNYSLREIFNASKAQYKLFYNDSFTVFSPESFIQIREKKIFSYPMKGTIDASIANAKEVILCDKKELAEHITIVDLIRNDLSIVSKNVRVNKFRYIDTIKTSHKDLLQVSSEIIGDLPDDFNEKIGDLLQAILPAGSITGAPKKKTVEIIKGAEKYDRGFYTGVFGYFDGTTLDSAVMIRFIEKTEQGLIYKSGGGITVNSDLEKEYNELNDKIYVPTI